MTNRPGLFFSVYFSAALFFAGLFFSETAGAVEEGLSETAGSALAMKGGNGERAETVIHCFKDRAEAESFADFANEYVNGDVFLGDQAAAEEGCGGFAIKLPLHFFDAEGNLLSIAQIIAYSPPTIDELLDYPRKSAAPCFIASWRFIKDERNCLR